MNKIFIQKQADLIYKDAGIMDYVRSLASKLNIKIPTKEEALIKLKEYLMKDPKAIDEALKNYHSTKQSSKNIEAGRFSHILLLLLVVFGSAVGQMNNYRDVSRAAETAGTEQIQPAPQEGSLTSEQRKAYQEVLRNEFLDMGKDIKVLVTGKNNTRLILSYVLFNDVWFRRFDTKGWFDGWEKIGFERIDIRDGDKDNYDYWKTRTYRSESESKPAPVVRPEESVKQKIIKTFSGTGTQETKEFVVNGSWRAQWTFDRNVEDRNSFFIKAYDKTDNQFDVSPDQTAGQGISVKIKGGKYHLKVWANGAWTVKIVQVAQFK